ncbi:DUF4350 domain-containing protein [Kitasatospora sp. NPDC092948]|uniref:DUF4350 domain-containing protein n=1 Tax=Kitasatospora sp. NPDC092948 TaxID=3364088 RepID=UPI003808C30C
MTTTAPPPATADPAEQPAVEKAAGTTPSTLRPLWRRWRWRLVAGLAVLLVGVLVAGIPGSDGYPPLDPRSGDAEGTRAVDQLLQQHGITSRTAGTERELAAALRADDTTVVLTLADELTDQELGRLSTLTRGRNSRVVLIDPDEPALRAFASGVHLYYSDAGSDTAVDPGCQLPEAANAGPADLRGANYEPGSHDTGCYPQGSARYALVSRTSGTQQLIVVGSTRPFVNGRLDHEGNAALALGLLGAHHQLVWQIHTDAVDADPGTPGTSGTSGSNPGSGTGSGSTDGGSGGGSTGGGSTDGGSGSGHSSGGRSGSRTATHQKTFDELIPAGWNWAALQLAIATVLAAAWRARRLGPVLSERLPAVVRASETAEGRARLYHRANARGHAAETLRRAARRRAATALGLPHTSGDPDPAALTEAAAARLGRPAADLQQLLYGPAPTDDAALLRLADDLDDMEWQVRQP